MVLNNVNSFHKTLIKTIQQKKVDFVSVMFIQTYRQKYIQKYVCTSVGRDTQKTVLRVYDKVRFKPACSATETS